MNLTPEQVKQERERFATWANGKGYDIAYTYDTERSRWVFFNPMTADLFEAWQAALLRSAGDGQLPIENYALQLLVAAGYITQDKSDQAMQLARETLALPPPPVQGGET